jgi:DNA-binding LacI/PurR family transcriptional regulator
MTERSRPRADGAGGRRATSADVASAAGVSRATVSYVLNGTTRQKIPERTRQRVLDAVARLGYAPSAAARELRSGRSTVVVLLLPDWPIGPNVGRVIEHLSAALAESGLTLVVHPRTGSSRPMSEVWRAIQPAALISWDDLEAEETQSVRAAGIGATVQLLGSRVGRLSVTEQRTGRLQAEHLAATGHRRLGYAFPDDERVVSFARPRLDGVRAACADLGLDEPTVLTVGLQARSAADAVRAWRTEHDVTAICAYNDEVAMAVLAGLRAHGWRAPDDLAVIGVDDLATAALCDPPLTSVSTDPKILADYLAASVTAELAGEPAPRRPDSTIGHLILRESA